MAALSLALLILAAGPATAAKEITVGKGDSLWQIAKQHGVTVDALRTVNGLAKGEAIKPGQKLRIPFKGRVTAPPKGQQGKLPWWRTQPPIWTQTQKSIRERGGINPCDTKNPGNGIYTPWDRSPTIGQLVMPQRGGITKDGAFDVMFHFHGHEAIRKEWVQVVDGAVLVGIDLGIGSLPYLAEFHSPIAFPQLVKSVEQAMARHTGTQPAHARHVGLSSWSAGYGAIQAILKRPYGRKLVDTLIILDGMHTGYTAGKVRHLGLKPFIDFARRAQQRQKLMFLSHSSIIPPGYASSTETANYLIHELGGKPSRTRPRGTDPMGLDLIARYSSGNLHVRGYSGNDKMDHCAHIGLLRDILAVHVKPRWRSPKGSKAPEAKRLAKR